MSCCRASSKPGKCACCRLPSTRSTRFISPTKTLEYLAAGKPVVSTAVADVRTLYGDVVRIADDHASFVAACHVALDEEREGGVKQQRRWAAATETVHRSSWQAAADTVSRAIERAFEQRLEPAGLV